MREVEQQVQAVDVDLPVLPLGQQVHLPVLEQVQLHQVELVRQQQHSEVEGAEERRRKKRPPRCKAARREPAGQPGARQTSHALELRF